MKHPNFGKPKPTKGKETPTFDLHHYAGSVGYSVAGWLEKNKDPINTTVAKLFMSSKGNKVLSHLYADQAEDDSAAEVNSCSGFSLNSVLWRSRLSI